MFNFKHVHANKHGVGLVSTFHFNFKFCECVLSSNNNRFNDNSFQSDPFDLNKLENTYDNCPGFLPLYFSPVKTDIHQYILCFGMPQSY